jgi:hypothetical protein
MRIPTRAKGEKGKPRITINIEYIETAVTSPGPTIKESDILKNPGGPERLT